MVSAALLSRIGSTVSIWESVWLAESSVNSPWRAKQAFFDTWDRSESTGLTRSLKTPMFCATTYLWNTAALLIVLQASNYLDQSVDFKPAKACVIYCVGFCKGSIARS